ncbi:hydrogen peroxide-inducible genes activator [Pelagibacterium luteolum]|uniref:LysR family transcriptional regulator, hydrogen peroxide-inducible genes activator n=1 Tax=Pelagibacterium luteolum TaxID=440168 RepID=A0A1G7UJA8_9HYPH|nr:hydrogen peroxide-inducible genes activator [Pelagibacterium luteolum]SDG47642.1 LysR family transcriptional regulator, hydrogen peroxide-inducible genes activator [Pelagibacterium luteolum]
MHTITLRQLHYAQIIAEEGHFGRAAERCHVTQPALSQQVKALEDRCKAPIFDRLGKSVRLTPFGRDFLTHAGRVLNAASDLETFADMSAGHPSRPLRFGFIPTVAPYLLPDILPALKDALPATHFSVSEGKTERLTAALTDGNIDLALIATDIDQPNLTSTPLFADPFVLATQKGTTITEPVSLPDLPREQFLLLEEGHCLRDQMVDACALKPDLQGRTFAATSLTTILELVANGYGVTLLPAISLRREAHNQRIALHALSAPGAARLLRLVWRSGSPYDALFRQIGAIVKAVGNANLQSDLHTQ